MNNIIISSTPVVLWHSVVQDAETKCGLQLREELESYLVFLLMRYLSRPDLAKRIMAAEYLTSMAQTAKKRELALQAVGDECLLFSGLFPRLATKRLVKISYFVKLGRTAYLTLSQVKNDLYGSLAKQFVPIMDILQSIRSYSELLPIEAYDLWNETNSQRALAMLKEYTKAFPVQSVPREEGTFYKK